MDPNTQSNMRIIDKIKENIKGFIHSKYFDEFFWFCVVICTSLASFALGMRHERDLFLQENPLALSKKKDLAELWQEYEKNKKSSAEFFASKNGTVFYPLACPSGDRIADENRVYFETEKEALEAGYKVSARCN